MRAVKWATVAALVTVTAAAAALTGCASSAEQRELEYRVNQLRNRTAGAPNETLGDLRAEVLSLEREIARLTGRVEVLEHELATVVSAAVAATAGVTPSEEGVAGVAATAVPENVAGVPAQTFELDVAPESASALAVVPESAPVTAVARESAPAASESTASELESYQAAYEFWLDDENDACVEHFGAFLQNFPNSNYTQDAHYWRADCYYRSGDLTAAVLSFNKVVADYAESTRAPDALYRMGEALLALGPSRECAAVRAFERVVAEYPASRRAEQAANQLLVLTDSCNRAPTAP